MPRRPPMPEKNKDLIRLARLGDMEAVQEWIATGNVPIYLEQLPFVLSDVVLTGFISIVRLLLRSYDWKQWPKELDSALATAVGMSRADIVRLLIDAGAHAEHVDWQDVLNSYSTDLIVAMIRARRNYDDIFEWSFSVSKPAMAAFRIVLQDDNPELVSGLVKGIIEAEEGRWETWERRESQRAEKLFSVLCWAGIDTRHEVAVESEYEEKTFTDSMLGLAIRRGTARRLKALAPNRNDLGIIRRALHEPCELDEAKLDLLLDAGLTLNDRDDGTSSFLRSAIDHYRFKSAVVLAKKGAKLQSLTIEEFRKFRRDSLYECSRRHHLTKSDIEVLEALLPPEQQEAYCRSAYYPLL